MDRAGYRTFHFPGFAKGADLELAQFNIRSMTTSLFPAIAGDHVNNRF